MTEPLESGSLSATAARLRAKLAETHAAREGALRTSREAIQFSSRSIRAVHREEMEAARALASQARACVTSVREQLRGHPEVYFANYVHDGQKEYVEAECMLAIASGRPLPTPEDLGVEPAAYLNGIAEAASEARRFVLDRLRAGQLQRAEALLGVMDDIYDELITVDFPDAITGGLRRTTDALRAVLERTRGDITMSLAQYRLEESLRRAGAAPREQSD